MTFGYQELGQHAAAAATGQMRLARLLSASSPRRQLARNVAMIETRRVPDRLAVTGQVWQGGCASARGGCQAVVPPRCPPAAREICSRDERRRRPLARGADASSPRRRLRLSGDRMSAQTLARFLGAGTRGGRRFASVDQVPAMAALMTWKDL